MKKLGIIIAESSLEIINNDILHSLSTPSKYIKHKGSILDTIIHPLIHKQLSNRRKRGRPDIIHRSLLSILDSPLNDCIQLVVRVHTLNDYVIDIVSETRLPRSQRSFCGLIKQLFDKGRVPPQGDPLIKIRKSTLSQLIYSDFKKADKLFLFSQSGKLMHGLKLGSLINQSSFPLVIIGGFPHGSIISDLSNHKVEIISIYQISLSTSSVISYILSSIFMTGFPN